MTESQAALTSDQIAAAEKLFDLNFSAEQREQMLKTLNDRLAQYAGIHALPLDNSVAMALNFSVKAADPGARRRPAQLRYEPAARRHAPAGSRRPRLLSRDAARRAHPHAPGNVTRTDRDVPGAAQALRSGAGVRRLLYRGACFRAGETRQ